VVEGSSGLVGGEEVPGLEKSCWLGWTPPRGGGSALRKALIAILHALPIVLGRSFNNAPPPIFIGNTKKIRLLGKKTGITSMHLLRNEAVAPELCTCKLIGGQFKKIVVFQDYFHAHCSMVNGLSSNFIKLDVCWCVGTSHQNLFYNRDDML